MIDSKIDIIVDFTYNTLIDLGFNPTLASYINAGINIIAMFLIAIVIFVVCKYSFKRVLNYIAQRTKTRFDDLLISNKTAKYISHLVPLLFIYKAVPIILQKFIYWEGIFGKIIDIYIIVLILLIIRTIFNALRDHLKLIPRYSDKPIDSYIQVIMIVLWVFGSTAIVLMLFNISISKLLTAFGAISAVIILVFRDTILGFIASVQVSVNDMVRIGDWITMEKFGADGDVIEINLATVKVRNFDKTISTIPTYSLISDSFKNWRGMFNSDGRRIKRHVLIKSSSIRFVSDDELSDLKKIQLISSYITERQADIMSYNNSRSIDKTLLINGRNFTNFGLFRKYINEYLSNHQGLNKDMIMMCRQLQPNEFGVPLEIYAFSSDKNWINYEFVMADIFDHIIASVAYFDLEIYELPTGKNTVLINPKSNF
ncbi:mechanosensitive ion channel domain-containing protein [Flavobacterium sp.]|uniref:mechanosensitive ion channel family protein n=1 Tax=Flavobacterium sp. TaxID=239 RepID=UPI002601EE1D|nr:mechanosensitive ion channel domain-containing protein [Flavobacterium sp.]MDD3005025.1 mechanosensitive ion channel [Flavobacterium sp.]